VDLGRQFHLLPFAADTVTYIICMRRTGLYRQVYEKNEYGGDCHVQKIINGIENDLVLGFRRRRGQLRSEFGGHFKGSHAVNWTLD